MLVLFASVSTPIIDWYRVDTQILVEGMSKHTQKTNKFKQKNTNIQRMEFTYDI